MNKRTYQIISAVLLVGICALVFFTFQNYSKYQTNKDNYTEAKKSFDTGNKEYLAAKNIFEKAEKDYNDTKDKYAELKTKAESEAKKVDTSLQKYLDNGTNTNDLLATMSDKLSSMEAPEGTVFRKPENGTGNKPILAHTTPTVEQAKEEWPDFWEEGSEISKIINRGNITPDEAILERVKDLIATGRPYKDNEWPEEYTSPDGVRGITIGTPSYDSDLGTNFSGDNSGGKYAAAKDNKVSEKHSATSNEPPSKEEAYIAVKKYDGNDPDIVYNDVETGKDSKGAYRKIKASSKSAQAQGGSGSLGFVKVYSDGTVVETTVTD